MNEIRFFVPGIPKTAGSKRAFVNPKTKRIIITDDNRKGKDWRASVQQFALAAMPCDPVDFALEVIFEFILPRPQGHYGAKGLKPSAPKYPEIRPDVLKMARAVEDSLTGICWRDDAQIVTEHLEKRYSDNGKAGCWITIREMAEGSNNITGFCQEPKTVEQLGLRALGMGG